VVQALLKSHPNLVKLGPMYLSTTYQATSARSHLFLEDGHRSRPRPHLCHLASRRSHRDVWRQSRTALLRRWLRGCKRQHDSAPSHVLLPHLEAFRFALVGQDDDLPLFGVVVQFLRTRPLPVRACADSIWACARGNSCMGSCPNSPVFAPCACAS
jgi:hypothetical protein